MKKEKVLITDDVHQRLLDGLAELNYQVVNKAEIKYQAIHSIISEFSGIVINSKVKMNRELITLGANLKFIARLGSGLEIIDQDCAREKGIFVFSAPEGNRNAVAEHALGMLLALANQLVLADQDVRSFHWNRESRRGFELSGKKIGIIGFGNNGSCFAEKLAGFGVKILAFDKYKKQFGHLYSNVVETSLEDIQKSCDVISLHVPLDNSTKFMVDSKFIDKCRDGVIIINSARGKVVDTKALITGLETGQIGGACLDVFENEKPATYSDKERIMYEKLYQFNNVILSPHVAGWTHESKYKIADSLLQQISNLATKY